MIFTPAKLLRNLLIYAYQWGEKDVIDFLGNPGEKVKKKDKHLIAKKTFT